MKISKTLVKGHGLQEEWRFVNVVRRKNRKGQIQYAVHVRKTEEQINGKCKLKVLIIKANDPQDAVREFKDIIEHLYF